MRWLACIVLLSYVSPVRAADMDEDKAKEITLAFLKAVKAKDLDAVMKTVDVPFLFGGGPGAAALTKPDEVKERMKKFLDSDVQPEKVPAEVGTVLDMAAVRKKVEGKDKDRFVEQLEKVAGKDGYVVMMVQDGKERGGILVKVKDGKAKVVGIPR